RGRESFGDRGVGPTESVPNFAAQRQVKNGPFGGERFDYLAAQPLLYANVGVDPFDGLAHGLVSLGLLLDPSGAQVGEQRAQHARDGVGGLLENARIDRGETATHAGAIRIDPAVKRQYADRLVFLQAQGKPYRFEGKIFGERFAEGVGGVFSTVRSQG